MIACCRSSNLGSLFTRPSLGQHVGIDRPESWLLKLKARVFGVTLRFVSCISRYQKPLQYMQLGLEGPIETTLGKGNGSILSELSSCPGFAGILAATVPREQSKFLSPKLCIGALLGCVVWRLCNAQIGVACEN